MTFVYRFVWLISQPFIKAYFIIRGYYRVKKIFKEGDVYYVSETNLYYKYLGENGFQEGNKVVDAGFLVIPMPGHVKVFSYLQIGMMHFMFIRKEYVSPYKKQICLKRKKTKQLDSTSDADRTSLMGGLTEIYSHKTKE